MSDNPENSELEEIIEYNGNEKYFQKYNEDLKKLLNFKTIYHDKSKKVKKYIGNIINGKYYGRGILYDENGKIEFNGYFKEGNYEGFGKKYFLDKLEYEGFFSENEYNGKGILYKDGTKIYEGEFRYDRFEGIGIEYSPNGNRIRKMKYSRGYSLEKCYGVLYDENNKEIYCGLLINGKPKEGIDITIYDHDRYKKYKGDFSSFKYNGKGISFYNNKILFEGIFKDDYYFNGILYYKDGYKQYEGGFLNYKFNGKGTLFFEKNNNKYFEGFFLEGKYIVGKLFDPNGKIIYEGDYKDKIPKQGKNMKLYGLDGVLFFEGNIDNYKYIGFGKLYIKEKRKVYFGEFKNGLYDGKGSLYKDSMIKYEGQFMNGKYNGIGKLYETDDKNEHYLYYEGNFKDNKMFGKGIKYYKNGSKKIEGIFDNINSYEGKYYSPENKEIFRGKIKSEIPVNSINFSLYNDKGKIVYENKIYEENKLNDLDQKQIQNNIKGSKSNKKENKGKIYSKISQIILVSSGQIPGKTCVLDRLIDKTYSPNHLATIGMDFKIAFYEYDKLKYKLLIWDFGGQERFRSIVFIYLQRCDIIIYLVDLNDYKKIDEKYINRMKEKLNSDTKLIYLVGNKLDMGWYSEKYRNKAKKLIDRGKVDKYFELSAKTNEGFDKFYKVLKIDAALIK